MTILEQLNEVNAAISAILGGAQEYRIGSRTMRRADLSVLFTERQRLEAAVANENGYTTSVVVFDRR